MVQLDIPCMHDSGKEPDFAKKVPNHHPLTRDEIKELLDMAAANPEDGVLLNQIHVRLNQGIRGMVCPRDVEGEAAEHERQVGALYTERWDEGGTQELVDALDKLLNW